MQKVYHNFSVAIWEIHNSFFSAYENDGLCLQQYSIAQEAIILSMFVEVNNGDSKNTN
jgi:hypothetical protein